MLKQLRSQLTDPEAFFNDVRSESWKPCFVFFLRVTLFISLVTPVMNYLGVESTDLSSSYQAQIAAYNLVKTSLITQCGVFAYLLEAPIIIAYSIPILFFLTLLLHAVYRLIGGQGPVLNAWKAACYGTGPCLLGGFLPYVSLFAGFYSFAMQFYLGPMTLYRAKESRAIVVFTSLVALTFIEMFALGTTIGF